MGAYTLLQDLTVATNSTSVVLNDFGTITKDDFIKVVATITNATASQQVIRLFPNNDTTLSNYHRQFLLADGSSVSAQRVDNNVFGVVLASSTESNFAYLKLSENDKFNMFSQHTRGNTSGVNVFFDYTTSTSSFTSGITSLTFSGATNAIGTGSRIQIYKLDAEKVADITVASNTTQVDISNLSIDKDSEYLLVSELLSSGGDFMIFPNDLTTNTAYYSQFIQGSGSGSGANRVNLPRFGTGSSSTNGLTYAHIKLSNIGAFTVQSYEMHGYGTSSIQILNWFISSEAENITSISKLNIKNTTNNATLAGSRFILYKLYE